MLLVHDLTPHKFHNFAKLLPENTQIVSKEMNNIHPCCGCFKCWLKTPGKCVINDDYTSIPKLLKENDIFLIISEIKYGCYSSYIKNVIERSLGFLLPFMIKKINETHHIVRYKRHIPKIIFIGYGEDVSNDEKETFKEISKANAINLGAENNYICHIASDLSDIEKILKSII